MNVPPNLMEAVLLHSLAWGVQWPYCPTFPIVLSQWQLHNTHVQDD